jgi:hypothetical protein
MSNGTSPGFQVTSNSLRNVAQTWDGQATAIGTIPGKTEGIHLNRLNAGIFQLIVSPYEAVLNAVTDRASEGKSEMGNIATSLRTSADTYDKTENGNVSIIQQVGH